MKITPSPDRRRLAACHHCQGEGSKMLPKDGTKGWSEMDRTRCPKCNGSGREQPEPLMQPDEGPMRLH